MSDAVLESPKPSFRVVAKEGSLGVEDGSLLEISNGGKTPLMLPTGETRSFLEDGDELVLTARCHAPGAVPIGFGFVAGRVVPAGDGSA